MLILRNIDRLFNKKVKREIRFHFLFLFVACCIGLPGCQKRMPENIITENHFDSLELASFVEADFPFITSSLDNRNNSKSLPQNNVVSRGIIFPLGADSYACFDSDLLRWSVFWTDDFMTLTGMAQVSYNDFFNKRNSYPVVLGKQKISTGIYPGWSLGNILYEDPRSRIPEDRPYTWGPLEPNYGLWEGIILNGEKAYLKYNVGKTEITETPGAEKFSGGKTFIRSYQLGERNDDIFLTLAEITNGLNTETEGHVTIIEQEKDTVTAVALLNIEADHFGWVVKDNRYISLKFNAGEEILEPVIISWKGAKNGLNGFEEFVSNYQVESFPKLEDGGASRWPEEVYTKGQKSPDTASFVTDQLTLPLPNPWKRNMRIMDVAFYKDGTGAVVTFSGDVWLVSGVNDDLDLLTWKRFASGLNEPMSIEIINDEIYVFDRLGIQHLQDLNGDREADFYRMHSNIMPQSMETREWAADMVVDPNGDFYIAKGGALNAGPKISKVIRDGFRLGSRYDGSILKISSDGKRMEVIATGLRGPYLGINPKTGFLTSSDQQGNFVPSTPLYAVRKGDYYGVEATAHMVDTPEITQPLLWIPHNVDQSGLGQVWATSDKMGPLSNQLIHISFGRPGLFKILIDSTENGMQGGISYIQAHYPTPVSKGETHPIDGQVYVAGFNLWGSKSKGVSSLNRLRYTGQPDYLPTGFEAGTQGVILDFGIELDPEEVAKIGNYQVSRYNYNRTSKYGSGHFKRDGSAGEESLPVLSAHLSEDRQSVLLVIPNMVEIQQMEIYYDILSSDGYEIKDGFYFSVKEVNDLDLEKSGFINVKIEKLTFDPEEYASNQEEEIPTVEKGKNIFQTMACAGCHSPGTRTEGMYGPPFKNLFGSERKFEDGSTTVADELYLKESLLEPDKRIVEGYSAEMPSFVGILSDSDMESLILYIKSLSDLKL